MSADIAIGLKQTGLLVFIDFRHESLAVESLWTISSNYESWVICTSSYLSISSMFVKKKKSIREGIGSIFRKMVTNQPFHHEYIPVNLGIIKWLI
jgi:hypothetical protein